MAALTPRDHGKAVGFTPAATEDDVEWGTLSSETRDAVRQLMVRGFTSAAVRLVVRDTGCSSDAARRFLRTSW